MRERRKRITNIYSFLPSYEFNYKNYCICGVSLMIDLEIFKRNKEIFFEEKRGIIVNSIRHRNKKIYTNDLIKCSYDGIELQIKIDRKILKKFRLNLKYKIKGYTLEYFPNPNIAFAESININEGEFNKLIHNGCFDNSDNKPVHNINVELY